MKKNYVVGNWLRGYYEGKFETMEEAWSFLSNRFLLAYPSEGGRFVCMWVLEDNKYGIEELVICNKGEIAEINNLPKKHVLELCKRAPYSFL